MCQERLRSNVHVKKKKKEENTTVHTFCNGKVAWKTEFQKIKMRKKKKNWIQEKINKNLEEKKILYDPEKDLILNYLNRAQVKITSELYSD